MDKYRLTKALGEGTFAIVYEAQFKATGAKLAIKKIKERHTSWDRCLQLRELRSLKTLGRHPNIVALKELILDKQFLHFVFELLPLDLHKVIVAQAAMQRHWAEERVAYMAYGLFSGISHMHGHGFMHRDLKPENVLCDPTGLVLKIADLGLAREIRSKPPYTDYVATRWYRAPELVLSSRVYSSPVDIWAAGAILFELLALRPLLPGASDMDMASRMCTVFGTFDEATWTEGCSLASRLRVRLPPHAKPTLWTLLRQGRLTGAGAGAFGAAGAVEEAHQLLTQMMKWDPRQRLSCTAALSSAFLSRAATFDPGASSMRLAKAPGAGSLRGDPSSVPRPARAASTRAEPPVFDIGADTDLLLTELEQALGEAGDVDGPARIGASSLLPTEPRPLARKPSIRDSGRLPTSGVGLRCGTGAVVDDAELYRLFTRFDADESGALDRWELALLLSEMGLLTCGDGDAHDAATRAWLHTMDSDGDGLIEWPELRRWWHATDGGKSMLCASRFVGKLRLRVGGSAAGSTPPLAPEGTPPPEATGDAVTTALSTASSVDAGALEGGRAGLHGLSAADTHALRSLFSRHDADFSGYIDLRELAPLLVDLGVLTAGASADDREAEDLLAEISMMEMDANEDGKLSFDELRAWWAASGRGRPPPRQDVKAARALSRHLVAQMDA